MVNRTGIRWNRYSWWLALCVGTLGVLSAFVFCVIHQLIISSIWFAIGAMLVAGAVCGTCLRLELRIEH